MLMITERSTNQTNLIDKSVLRMISLFVVAYPHEVEAFEVDNFAGFIVEARKEGRLILPKVEGVEETVEVSRTRKGFLIKISVTEQLAEQATKPLDTLFEESVKLADRRAIPGFPNYELGNDGFIYNVKSGAPLAKGPSYKLWKDGDATRLSMSTIQALFN